MLLSRHCQTPSQSRQKYKIISSFYFLLFKISKNENNVKILSIVEYDFLNPNWFSSSKKTSSKNTRSLSFKIAVNSLPRQLSIVIGRKFNTPYQLNIWYKACFKN